MDSLVGYGSDDEGESGRYGYQSSSGGGESGPRRREDDTNYDDVNMDMSEESQDAESEPELPPAVPPAPAVPHATRRPAQHDKRESSSRERDRSRSADGRDKRRERDRERERERPRERERHSRERRSPRRDERRAPRRGLLGDRPVERPDARAAPLLQLPAPAARPAPPPRFVDARERRDRDRERDRDRDNRPDRRCEDPRAAAGARAAPPPLAPPAGPSERRGSPPAADYRPSSYKVNKKLEVMEKMGLQIKTPDGSMATARQLRAATQPAGAPAPFALQSHRALDQVHKRKLLWGKKGAAAEAEAARWSGARFAQDADGRQVSKFMRLMGIKDAAAAKGEPAPAAEDPNRKQEELFQAMQAQYEVARAATHTMRGVGLGFQRGNF